MLSEARDPTSRHEPLAALGSSLALLHRTLSASGFSGAALGAAVYRIEELCVVETDPQGRSVWAELFAVDRLGDAVTRLYERYAERLPDGGSRAHASAIARSVATVLGPPDPDLVHPVLALDVRYADHRALGWGPAHGVVAFVRALRTLRGALRNVEAQTIELLGARPDALVVRRTVAGELAAGDRYRRRPIVLWRFGAGGRVTQWEQFDGDQRAEALARFDELAAPPAPTRLFETAATAAVDRFDRAWASRDWTGVTALFAPEFRYGDRRARMQLDLDRAAFSEFMRPLFEMEATHSSHEVLATRGERLVLIRLRYAHAEGDVGPDESTALLVIEVNARGERIALVRFDPADRVGAHAELDARYAAGEAAEYPAMWALLWDVRRALAARNWDQLSRLVAADLTAEDHRLLGWGVARSPEEYAAALRPLAEVHPDVKLRLNHLVLRAHSALFVASWTGSEAEAEFEIPVAIVFRSGPDGRIDRVHHYSLEQIGAARARFAEFATPPHGGVRRIENAATRWMFETRPSRSVSEPIATRGDRLALMRIRFEGSDDAVGASEIESLTVVEVDASGHRSGAVRVDTDDLDAAYARLEARYAAGEAAASPHVAETMRAFRAAFAARDWDALVALMSPDLVVDDHRPLGWETVRGANSYVQALHSLVDLAPDTRLRLDHVEMSQRGLLWIGAWVGTREGGEYEIPWITVSEHDARGVLVRFAVYDLEQLDTARARYGELAAPARPNITPTSRTAGAGA
jgi:hypothetical protein